MHVAACGAAGIAEVLVRRKPVVAVLPTGDEIRPIGSDLAKGQFYDTNSLLLAALAEETGCEAIVLPIQPDDSRARGLRGCRRPSERLRSVNLAFTVQGSVVPSSGRRCDCDVGLPCAYRMPIRHSSSCTAGTLRWNIRNASISFVWDTQFLRPKLFLSSNQSLRWSS